MNDDELANLLGEAPQTADPRFRIEVYARVTERARARAAFNRALRIVAVFTAIGLFFPLTRAAGLSWAELQPMFLVAALAPLAYLMAVAAIRGPKALRWVRQRVG